MQEDLETRMKTCLENISKGMGIEKACKEANLSTKTFYQLKTTPEWAEKYKKAREKGLIASGIDMENAIDLVEKEGEGFRIEKPHVEKAIPLHFLKFLLEEQGEKTISNELKQAFLNLEKVFEIVENGKNAPFWELHLSTSRFSDLYDLLWQIQHSLNRINNVLDLFRETRQREKENYKNASSLGES